MLSALKLFVILLKILKLNTHTSTHVYEYTKWENAHTVGYASIYSEYSSLQDQCVSSADLLGDPWCGSYITSPTPLQAVDYTTLASVRETWKIMQRNLVRIDPMR